MGTKYRGTKAEILALDTFIKLRRAVNSVDAVIGVVDERSPRMMSETRFGMLEALYHLGPLCQQELGEKILTSKANVTMIVDKLSAQGLVRRTAHPENRRMVLVELTDAGAAFVKESLPDRVDRIRLAFDHLDSDERKELGRLCKKLGLGISRATTGDGK